MRRSGSSSTKCPRIILLSLFFFFQAEDGIRDPLVTGVQTCALPIFYKQKAPSVNACKPPEQWQTYDITFRAAKFDASGKKAEGAHVSVVQNGQKIIRSEERRVGKECRYRGSAGQDKKKKTRREEEVT